MQAFGVRIEASERIHVFGQAEIRERAPARARLGCELREHAVGFVKCEEYAMNWERACLARNRIILRAGRPRSHIFPCAPSNSQPSTNSPSSKCRIQSP